MQTNRRLDFTSYAARFHLLHGNISPVTWDLLQITRLILAPLICKVLTLYAVVDYITSLPPPVITGSLRQET